MPGTIHERGRARRRRGTPSVEVLYFTDPYCSWCWAAEPVMMRLKENYGAQVAFRTLMGGLVEHAGHVLDADGQRLVWLRHHMHDVSQRSGQPIEPVFLDAVDDEFSTWPACIHVKAAALLGADLGERYLRRMRRAIMTEGQQGSDPRVAESLTHEVEGLDITAWRNGLSDGTALQAFLADREACGTVGATGFPTLLIRVSDPKRQPRLLVGYRPYADIEHHLLQAAPWLVPRGPRPIVDLLFDAGPLTTREVQEIQAMSPREALDALDGLEAEGTIARHVVGGGTFWHLAEADEEE